MEIACVQDYAVLGLIVLSVSSVQTCETWNYVEYFSPLAYSKFYSGDTKICLANSSLS